MKHLALAFALLLTPAVYAVEDVTPATITAGSTLEIVGPTDAIAPGADAWLKVSGLTLDEIKAAKAANQFDMTVFPLTGTRVHATYDWLNDTLELMFRASTPGEYLVKLHLLRDGKLEIAAIVVVVEGDFPDPFPDPKPDPDPSPIPPGPRAVVIISESLDRTPQEVAVETQVRRYLESQGVAFSLIDPTTPTVDNWLAPYLAEVKKRKLALPVLAVTVLPSPTRVEPHFIVAGSLPGRAAEALTIIQEALK